MEIKQRKLLEPMGILWDNIINKIKRKNYEDIYIRY